MAAGTLVYRNQIGVDHQYANAGRWRALDLPSRSEDWIDAGGGDELDIDQMKLVRVGTQRIVVGR
jgi:hypothetical protein